jgi:hypothetical protein
MPPATTTVRLRPKAHKALKAIARVTGESLPEILDRAIEDLRRKVYLEGIRADYAALRDDQKTWEEFRNESAKWDVTNNDGLGGV